MQPGKSAFAGDIPRPPGGLLGCFNGTRDLTMNMPECDEILRVENLVMHFPIYRGIIRRQVGAVHAVDGISFTINRGETLGLVGESGCGKSTTGRTILQLHKPSSGKVYFNGIDLTELKREEMRYMR